MVVQNFRHGVNERLGFGYEAVRKINPNIVYASLNMYGYDGPWAVRPGHEQLGQMGVGHAVRYGGDGEPMLQHVGAINDYGTGLMGAYAVALALYHRERTGEGGHVWTSLAHTAQILQSPFFYDYAQRAPWDEPRGPGRLGRRARCSATTPTSDGWMFLGASPEQKAGAGRRSRASTGSPSPGRTPRSPTSSLSGWRARRPRRGQSGLAPRGVGVHAVTRLEDGHGRHLGARPRSRSSVASTAASG